MTPKERAAMALVKRKLERLGLPPRDQFNSVDLDDASAALAATSEPSQAMIEIIRDAIDEQKSAAYVWRAAHAAMMAEKGLQETDPDPYGELSDLFWNPAEPSATMIEAARLLYMCREEDCVEIWRAMHAAMMAENDAASCPATAPAEVEQMSDADIVGHKTFSTGKIGPTGFPEMRHEPLTRAEADAFMEAADRAQEKRAADMPDEQSALNVMFSAWQRLKELGWSEAIYCPKDGTHFLAIEAGSTGVHDCSYQGKWPDGSWWVYDGDIWPSNPILWKKGSCPLPPNLRGGIA